MISQCPKAVKRCESCRYQFTGVDIIVVKITGEREYMDKNIKLVKQLGNVYLHYLRKCLKELYQEFEFQSLIVPKCTQTGLSEENVKQLADKGCVIER